MLRFQIRQLPGVLFFTSFRIYSIKIMFKKHQTPVVSDNESEGSDFENPDFDTYNENYSLMYSLSREFFSQCKKSVMKYLNFSKVGVKMNVGVVLGWLKSSEAMLDEQQQQRLDALKKRKELEFDALLARIRELVGDLMDFQKNFKAAFNEACKQPGRTGAVLSSSAPTPIKKFQRTIMTETTKTPQPTVHSIQRSKHSDDNQESVERSLRRQLQKIVLPKPLQFCSKQPKPTSSSQYLTRLTQKLNKMTSFMRSEKQRESKIVEIFNKNKIIVGDLDMSSPEVGELQLELERVRAEVKGFKKEVEDRKREYDRMVARLLEEMRKGDRSIGDKVYENEDCVVMMISKGKKKVESPRLMGLTTKSLLSYIYTLQQRLSTFVQTKRRSSEAEEAPHAQKVPSAINLNMSFNNVYSPIQVKNIIDSAITKKKK